MLFRHDIAEILLKVALNTITLTPKSCCPYTHNIIFVIFLFFSIADL